MIVNYEGMLVLDLPVTMPMPMRFLTFHAVMFMVVMFSMHMLMLVIDFVMTMSELRLVFGRPEHCGSEREQDGAAREHPGRHLYADARTELPSQRIENEPAGMG